MGRYAPGAARLADGRVLLAGGYSFEANRTFNTSEVFDPVAGSWSAGPSLLLDRNFPVPILLADGGWLLAGGYRLRRGTTASSERLDPAGKGFQAGPPLVEERELHTATSLADGRVLVTGGYSTGQRRTLASAEVYDPKPDQFAATRGSMQHARFGHAAVLLPDGRVLVVGGKVEGTNADVLPAELFDPRSGEFTATGALSTGRDRCTAWLLPDGKRVLVAGGSSKAGGTPPARRCEVYEVAAGRFTPGPELLRDRMAHTATALGDGRVLLVGGWSNSDSRTTPQAELWDPKAERFLPAGRLRAGRHDHAAVLLKDGRVLVAGGKEAPARNGIETPLEAETWSDSQAKSRSGLIRCGSRCSCGSCLRVWSVSWRARSSLLSRRRSPCRS